MSGCRDIKYCALEILQKSGIHVKPSDKDKVVMLLSEYIDCLMFNIVAVTCTIALSMGMRKILHEHLDYYRKYVDKQCGFSSRKTIQMRGGAFNTAAFYGINEPNYKAENFSSDIMNIDWANNLARPRLDSTMATMTGGGCNKLSKVLMRKINHIFKFFKITAKKHVRQVFVQIFDKYIQIVMSKLSKSKVLTYTSLYSVLLKTKIMKKMNIKNKHV